MYYSNVSVKAEEGAYVVLFSRELKKPHTIYNKTTLDGYESLLAGCARAIKLAKDDTIIFRTEHMRIRDILNGIAVELNDAESELVEQINEKNLRIVLRNELKTYNKIMEKELFKRRSTIEEEISGTQDVDILVTQDIDCFDVESGGASIDEIDADCEYVFEEETLSGQMALSPDDF